MKIYFTMKKVLVSILLAVVLLSNNLLFAQQQMNMEVKLESEYSYANEGNAVITSVKYDENLMLEINFQNARCTEDTNLNKYVNKKKSAGKVDMVVSLINATYLVEQDLLFGTDDFVVQT